MPIKIPETQEGGLNMTPMIDIVFNLVTFFMLTLDMSHKDLAVLELPRAWGGIEDKDPSTIPGAKNSTAKKIDSQWDRVTLQLDDFLLKEAEAVAACHGLLTAMQNKFSASNEYHFLWDQSQLTPQGLNLTAAALEQGRNCRFHVNLELHAPQGRTEIQRDPTPFEPQLRQMIAARNAQGKITGGSVMIAVEKPAPN